MVVAVGQEFGFGRVIDPDFRFPLTESARRAGQLLGRRGAALACDPALGGCGAEYVSTLYHLYDGHITSCGCYRKVITATTGRANEEHGLRKHPLYQTWKNVHNRCYNPNTPQFDDYGGRGIEMFAAWRDSPVSMIEYLERGIPIEPPHEGDTTAVLPPLGYSLDRISSDGNYEPGNIRWADYDVQNTNRRNSFTADELADIRERKERGESTISIAKLYGKNRSVIYGVLVGRTYSSVGR